MWDMRLVLACLQLLGHPVTQDHYPPGILRLKGTLRGAAGSSSVASAGCAVNSVPAIERLEKEKRYETIIIYYKFYLILY